MESARWPSRRGLSSQPSCRSVASAFVGSALRNHAQTTTSGELPECDARHLLEAHTDGIRSYGVRVGEEDPRGGTLPRCCRRAGVTLHSLTSTSRRGGSHVGVGTTCDYNSTSRSSFFPAGAATAWSLTTRSKRSSPFRYAIWTNSPRLPTASHHLTNSRQQKRCRVRMRTFAPSP